ncbi:MAG: (d)CMP kinase [Deltaproteobacteria bacterium]|jgi:CMP/dCMP kinase|nr:(d)CMP kinase [Deltaproteobacteria bacterium]MBT6434179.1 (d)CMP kinase [Deltaproteobacteria bacterium]MBT6489972.1 (d)CMP kinase [Deltaproteobacteria bacterium]
METKNLVIAIDGPAGAGKSTVSKAVAANLGLTLVDTGAIYRAVAYTAVQNSVSWGDSEGLANIVAGLNITFKMDQGENRVFIDGADVSQAIRTPEISQGASKVSSVGAVRDGLLQLQRDLAGAHGAVLEGRDIGTVVCPDAPVKIFLVASAQERARRRLAQMQDNGQEGLLADVLAEIEARDKRDTERAQAPLKPAEDAIHVDCTSMSIEEVIETIVAHGRSAS